VTKVLGIVAFIGLFAISADSAHAAETTLAGILYKPFSSLPAACTVNIKGPTVATLSGSTELVPTYKKILTDATGVYSFTIQPNDVMVPAGTSYLTEYNCSGVTWNEYWVIPSTGSTLRIADVRTATLPTPLVTFAPSAMSSGGASSGNCLVFTTSWGPGACGSGGGFANPMTTIGDIIVAAALGSPIRLAAVADNACSGPLTLTNAATVQRLNLTANCVITFPSIGLYPGQMFTLRLAQDATGGRTVSVSSNVHGFMVVSTGANSVSVQDFFWDDVKALWFARNTGVQNQ
jgi:hypothetical protein